MQIGASGVRLGAASSAILLACIYWLVAVFSAKFTVPAVGDASKVIVVSRASAAVLVH